jgi:hypothetical protein
MLTCFIIEIANVKLQHPQMREISDTAIESDDIAGFDYRDVDSSGLRLILAILNEHHSEGDGDIMFPTMNSLGIN